MMSNQQDLPSDSDDSDVDFKLSDEESLPSEEDSDGSVEEPVLDNEEEQNTSTGKRKKKQIKRRKKIKKKDAFGEENGNDGDKEESEEVKKLTAEEEKKKTDSLWNDFMKDCTPPIRKTSTDSDLSLETKEDRTATNKTTLTEKENKAVIKEIFEFAGEKIEVEKEIPLQPSGRGRGKAMAPRGRGRGGGGLASLIGQLGRKNKLSTLEKSKLDWDRFKKDEGIEEDLQTHNKGKEGFLEKQDFLQRTDVRQFEIEKQLRTTSRSNR
uniref:Craniofacial development protein 1 n=1 Tax=Graphocephala atropunctata TaxID=36148 RepID=A0A1B6KAI7_9HEMI